MAGLLLVSCFGNVNISSNNRLRSVYDNIDGTKLVLASDFNHWGKKYYSAREMANPQQIHIHVPQYKKNLSIKRIWSHIRFAFGVRSILKKLQERPSAVYCIMPTSTSAYFCARYCKKNNIKFIVDVVDLWPDSLLPIVRFKSIFNLLLYPWTYLTHYCYKAADVIMGESAKYAYEAKRYNCKAEYYSIYLGVDVPFINKVKDTVKLDIKKPDDEVWIGYAGNLGNSYDFTTLMKAYEKASKERKCKLLFIGDGDSRAYIEEFSKNHQLNIEIIGYCPYETLLAYLGYCDIAVNIFKENTKVIYSYKFNDYVAMGCFILNSLEGETAEMIEKYQIGLNFNFTDNPLSEVLTNVVTNWDNYKAYRKNLPLFVEKVLDKRKIYSVMNQWV